MKVSIDPSIRKGPIRPLHGVGQPPFAGVNFEMFSYLTDAGIPFSRLHDVGGAYGGFRWVDIPNIFRDFSADPTDPASYDFTFTDLLITALVEHGVEPFFRLGVTIENARHIKAYRIYPPTDNQKWAVICEHIIRHYTEGWANGFYYNIRYWEIWNEPDNYEDPMENAMWRGTKEQYFELYDAASKHLKKCFPHLKIGGYASCGFYAVKKEFVKEANSSPRKEYFLEFFDAFITHIKKSGAPLDFFSWHSYSGVESNRIYISYARQRLDKEGFTKTESICNEWNPIPTNKGTYRHAAETCANLLLFQKGKMDAAMFYDARWGIGNYGALFHPETKLPYPAYYAFTAFNELYKRENEIAVQSDDERVMAVAAKKDNDLCAVITNHTGDEIPFTLCADARVTRCLLTANGENEKVIALPDTLPRESILTVFFETSKETQN